MSSAISAWIARLGAYPGWRDWNRKKIRRTLSFDDEFEPVRPIGDFEFDDKTTKQHALIMSYMQLQETAAVLRECEYYFRRYPFRGLPVSRHGHLTNMCEMYFSRFYEFKSRLKNWSSAIKAVTPDREHSLGQLIKLFDKQFDPELRERNSFNHRERFSDVAIDRIFLTGSLASNKSGRGWEEQSRAAYRREAKEWALRVRKRSEALDRYLEAIAEITLQLCSFLQVTKASL